MTKLFVRAIAVVAVLIGSLAVERPAGASNFVTVNSSGWTQCTETPFRPCMGDSSTHDVYGGYLGPAMGDATFQALYGTYDTTNVDIVPTSPWASNSHTDIVFNYGPLAGDTVGRYNCDDRTTGWRCNRGIIIYDGADIAGWSADDLRDLACHEIGHSLGLVHGTDGGDNYSNSNSILGCMRTPLSGNYLLGAHGAAHLNNNY